MRNRIFTKKITVTCMSALLAASMMSGCGSSQDADSAQTSDSTPAASSEIQGTEASGTGSQIANPWEDTDAAGIKDLLGVGFHEPDNGVNLSYSICKDEGLAQMNFQDSVGTDFCVRAEKTDGLEDISGMYFDWTYEESCTIGICDGSLRQTSDGDNTIELCLWYDANAGISYCVSAEAADLDGLDLTGIAEQVYQQTYTPVESLSDAVGEYTCAYDYSTLSILADGRVNVSIYRLASFDGTTSDPENGVLTFSVKDPNDGDMTMTFDTFTDTLTVTASTWENFPEGTTVEFTPSQD